MIANRRLFILRLLLLIPMTLILVSAVFLPSENLSNATPKIIKVIYGWSVCIADVRNMAMSSSIPLPTAVSYSFALVLGIVVAVSIAVLIDEKQRTRMAIQKIHPVIMFIFLSLVVIAPFVFELRVNKSQFSYGFFKWVATSRAGLVLWTEGVFLFFCAASYWCVRFLMDSIRRVKL